MRCDDIFYSPSISIDGQRIQHRDELMDEDGRRPSGWWDYESDKHRVSYPGNESMATAVLYEAGLLTPDERTRSVDTWRYHFDRAQYPGFSYQTGGVSLQGAEARQAFYRWAGIPRSLLQRWTSEATPLPPAA
jgi:hypothetical protein